MKSEGCQPPLIFFLVSLIFSLPFLINWKWIGVGDWELFVTIAAVSHKSLWHFGQFPFWNPYLGGGNILFHHPEVGFLSPLNILVLIFGPILGIKLKMMAAYFLGFYGTFLFARRLGISKIASYLVALVYFGSSYFALHFAIGHVPFTHFCFLPWLVYFLLQTENNWKFLFAAAVVIALIILGNGAAVPFLYTLFFAAIFIVLYSFEQKKYQLIKRYIISILLGVLLAAVKFIPMYIYLSNNRWEGMTTDATPLGFLFKAFFSFDQGIFDTVKTADHWGWHEYSAYISPLVIVLAVVALIYSFKKGRIWLIIGLFFFVFGLGHFSEFSVWNLITQLPGFSSIRSPARAFQFVVLAAAMLSGLGLDQMLTRIKFSASIKRWAPILLILLIISANFMISLPALNSIKYKEPESSQFNSEFKNIIGSKYEIYQNFLKNRGFLAAPWLSAYKESRGIVTPDDQVLAEYVEPSQVSIISRNYTPNRVEYKIKPVSSGTIVFGIGFDPGWSAEDGRQLFEYQGLVATRFDPGDRMIVLNYTSPYFYLGLIISLIFLGLVLLFYLNPKLGKRLEPIFK